MKKDQYRCERGKSVEEVERFQNVVKGLNEHTVKISKISSIIKRKAQVGHHIYTPPARKWLTSLCKES